MDSSGSCPSVRGRPCSVTSIAKWPHFEKTRGTAEAKIWVQEDTDQGEVPGPSLTSHPLEKDSALPQHTPTSNNFQEPVQVQPRGRPRCRPKGRRNFQPPLSGHLREPLTLPRRSERLRQKALLGFMAGGEVLRRCITTRKRFVWKERISLFGGEEACELIKELVTWCVFRGVPVWFSVSTFQLPIVAWFISIDFGIKQSFVFL